MNAPFVPNHPQLMKLTVDDFEILADAGAFAHNKRTELIEGEIFAMNSLFRPHAYAHSQMLFELQLALRDRTDGLGALIAPSVRMPPDSMPEPDIVLTMQPRGERAVPLDTVRLAVEISDSTVAFDMGCKARVYADHGVPEYWVVDIEAKIIHQFWEPDDGRFAQQKITGFGTQITAITIDGLTIPTATLV